MKQKSIPITNSTGAKLWTRAKKIIPGGGQLLSKRSERFLPEYWPAYYKKAKGCEVWDLDGRHYFDFAQMGVGSCILGYADSEVDSQVIKAIQKGSMCTLNCSEEVRLAELLIELHPWAEMARFARTGGEACSVAVRIARAFSGRDKVAFCGYHGWHDWYLSANIANLKNLDGQLLPGLAPAGVPRSLKKASFPFVYNEVESLKQIVHLHGKNLAAIIMEPVRGASPSPGFLEAVREIADKTDAVLIFDEVTSGFRMCLGGYHLITNVKPDLAVFAKGMGNGYPAAAVIGKNKIMNAAQESFISSTSWTERIGSVAAIATIKKMQKINAQKVLIDSGIKIQQGLKKIANERNIPLKISGIPPLIYLKFSTAQPEEAQTFYTQEMLKKGFLVGSAIYTTLAYSDNIISKFLNASDEVFDKLSQYLMSNSLKKYLIGEVIHAGFKRLT